MKKALLWKLLERFGTQGIQFVLQIILARLLSPDHYGALSLILIFSTLATIFIQSGFNTSLVQNKDVTEEDYSSVFWLTMSMAGIIYVVSFFSAGLLAAFFEMPDIVWPFRVLMLMLFPGSLNSIQIAKVSREMNFRKVFTSSIIAIIISGLAGIVLALKGAGLWALVAQTLLTTTVPCVVMWFSVNWRPRFVFSRKRIGVLYSYGWKLLVSGLLETLYQNLSTLVVGKKYDAETLAYYNRGNQFPQFILTAINTSVQSVLLPAMSSHQDDPQQVKHIMRTSVTMSSYIIFPMMAGLAAVATPVVRLLLTDKWLPCVPFLQIFCLSQAFYPIHSCNLQAINAMGRSDIFLKLEVIKKTVCIAILFGAVFAFDSPIAIALSGIVSTLISFLVNAYPNKKLISYSYTEQVKDLLPTFVLAVAMFLVVSLLNILPLSPFYQLVVQILVGIVFYFGISALLRLPQFAILKNILLGFLKKGKSL